MEVEPPGLWALYSRFVKVRHTYETLYGSHRGFPVLAISGRTPRHTPGLFGAGDGTGVIVRGIGLRGIDCRNIGDAGGCGRDMI